LPLPQCAISILLFCEIRNKKRKFYYTKNTAFATELIEDHLNIETALVIEKWGSGRITMLRTEGITNKDK
jgi:hypothetical protein